jgi:hypothetical protein
MISLFTIPNSPFLADGASAFNPPVQIAAWLGCLAFGLMLFNEGAKFVDRIRGKAPHPPNEQLEFSVAAMDRRVCKLEEESAKIRAKMEADKSEILRAGELRAEKLHNRINPLAESIEGLKSAMELNNQQTVLFGAKLDRLMETRKA